MLLIMKPIPAPSDLSLRSPYDPEAGTEADLWFLPGAAADDEGLDPFAPLPRAAARGDFGVAEWRAVQGALAADLAQIAGLFGALDERLKRAGQGVRQRLALLEAAELSWQVGDRIAADRLALWVGLRLAGAQEDAQALARAGWATRRLAGGPGPEAGLAEFLGRHEGVPDRAGFEADLAGRLEEWRAALSEAADLHPIVQAALGFHLWRLAGISGTGPGADLEAAVAAARIAASAGRGGALFLPLVLAGPGAVRRGGTVVERLGRWVAGAESSVLAALLHLDQLAAWQARAEAATAGLSGRTPPKLIGVLADWPLVSAAMVEAHTGSSRAAAQRNLDWMTQAGLIREVTGQGRFRLWAAKL
jgi:hypothetical protein